MWMSSAHRSLANVVLSLPGGGVALRVLCGTAASRHPHLPLQLPNLVPPSPTLPPPSPRPPAPPPNARFRCVSRPNCLCVCFLTQWSLGAVVAELVTGHVLLQSESVQVSYQYQHVGRPWLSSSLASLPTRFAETWGGGARGRGLPEERTITVGGRKLRWGTLHRFRQWW